MDTEGETPDEVRLTVGVDTALRLCLAGIPRVLTTDDARELAKTLLSAADEVDGLFDDEENT